MQKGKPVQSAQEFYDFLFSVGWSPSGRFLATASFDKTVRVMYAGSGKQARALTGHRGPVFSVAWSHSGRFLASGSDDKTVRVWDSERKWKYLVLEGHEDWVLSVAWAFQEDLLASGSRDKTVRVWDTQKGTLRYILKGHTDIVNSVAWSPNGRYLASASDDGDVRVWNSQTQRQVMVLSGHKGAVLSVRFAPDGRLLASKSNDNTVWLWDCQKWKRVAVLKETVKSDFCNGLSFHPTKHQLATLSHDQKGIRVWELDYSLLLGDTSVRKPGNLICPECGESIPFSMMQRRLKRGHKTLTCPVCDTVISLMAEERNETSPDETENKAEAKSVPESADDPVESDDSTAVLGTKIDEETAVETTN
jgi:WD40 repeat protein